MSWVDYVGFLAALTVLATFCMDTILPLRGLAIASNILFIVYGSAGELYPVLLLHALLLPINMSKIVQLVRKNRIDARADICRAGPTKTGPSIVFRSLADSVRGTVHLPLTKRDARTPATAANELGRNSPDAVSVTVANNNGATLGSIPSAITVTLQDQSCGTMRASLTTRLHSSTSALRNAPTWSGESGLLS